MLDKKTMEQFARQELGLADAKLSASYFYQSLPLCAVDAVFSLGVRYQSTLNVVERLCKKAALLKYRAHGSSFPAVQDQFTISQCLTRLSKHAPEVLAEEFFENKQRTSTRKGILKARAVIDFMTVLKDHGVETFQDLASADANTIEAIEVKIRKIPGQASGKGWRYFLMLAGDDNQIKPDRMIERFLARFGGKGMTPAEAHTAITELAAALKADHPHITPRLLDHMIWSYERSTPAQAHSQPRSTPLAG